MSEVHVSHEFDELQRRGGKPYSAGHRVMYDAPLALLSRNDRATEKFTILDVGFGIGYGLDRMVEAGVIGRYLGFEPDYESYRYVCERHGSRPGVLLWNQAFDPGVAGIRDFDHTFCIEVIEHVPPDEHQRFIADLRLATSGTLWLSTPDKDRCPEHGVRTTADWRRLIDASFSDITVHQEQWTTLYICQ